MQIFIFLLVLLNALFFAFSQSNSAQNPSVDAQRVLQQVSPERIEILSHGLPPTQSQGCLSWLLPSLSAAQALANKLDKIQSTPKLTFHFTPQPEARWWVASTGFSTLADANKMASQVRALGLDSFSVIESDPVGQPALSFGVFINELAAKNLLDQLNKRGIPHITVSTLAANSSVRLHTQGPAEALQNMQNFAQKWQPEAVGYGPNCF